MSVITFFEDESMIEKCGHDFKMITGSISIDTYLDSGAPMDLSKQLPKKVHFVGLSGDGGYVGQYDYDNNVVKVFEVTSTDGGGLDAVSSGTDLAAVDMRFVAIGK